MCIDRTSLQNLKFSQFFQFQKTFLQKYGKSFQSLALKNNCVSRHVSNFLQNGQLVSLELDIDLNHNYVNPEFIKWLRKQDKLKKIVLKNNALNFVINEQLLSENLSFNLKEIVVQDGQVDPLTAVFIRQQSAEIEIFKFKEQTYYLSDEEINLLERALHGCHNLKHLYTNRFIGANPQNIYVNLETIEIQHSDQRGNANIFDILEQTCPNLLWVCANN